MRSACTYLVVIVCLLAGVYSLHAQPAADPVSRLKEQLKQTLHDSARCRVLSELAENASDSEWPGYNKELIALTRKKLADNSTEARYYAFFFATGINNLGYLERQRGNNADAVMHYMQAAELREKIGDLKGLSESLNNIGFVYKSQGNILNAITYYTRSLQLQEKIGDKNGMAISLNNLGSIYFNQVNIEKAAEYSERALQLYNETGNESGKANILGNLAYSYINLKKFDKALTFCAQSLETGLKLGDKKGIASAYENFGLAYEAQGKWNEALTYFNKSLEAREACADLQGISSVHDLISRIHFTQKNYQAAISHAEISLKFAQKLGYPENILHASNILYQVYRVKRDYKKAFEHYAVLSAMNDSIHSRENRNAGIKTQLRYEFEKKLSSDSIKHIEATRVSGALLSAQQSKLKQEKTQFWLLFGGLLLVAAGLFFVINRFNLTQKQKQIIETQKEQVDEAYSRLEEKNKEVIDSIKYARRIQNALLGSEQYILKKLASLKR